MAHTVIGVCTIEFELTDLESMKTKRGIMQSMMSRLRSTFNVAVAEVDALDSPSSAVVAFAVVSNSNAHANQMVSTILNWIEKHVHDAVVADQTIEIL